MGCASFFVVKGETVLGSSWVLRPCSRAGLCKGSEAEGAVAGFSEHLDGEGEGVDLVVVGGEGEGAGFV